MPPDAVLVIGRRRVPHAHGRRRQLGRQPSGVGRNHAHQVGRKARLQRDRRVVQRPDRVPHLRPDPVARVSGCRDQVGGRELVDDLHRHLVGLGAPERRRACSRARLVHRQDAAVVALLPPRHRVRLVVLRAHRRRPLVARRAGETIAERRVRGRRARRRRVRHGEDDQLGDVAAQVGSETEVDRCAHCPRSDGSRGRGHIDRARHPAVARHHEGRSQLRVLLPDVIPDGQPRLVRAGVFVNVGELAPVRRQIAVAVAEVPPPGGNGRPARRGGRVIEIDAIRAYPAVDRCPAWALLLREVDGDRPAALPAVFVPADVGVQSAAVLQVVIRHRRRHPAGRASIRRRAGAVRALHQVVITGVKRVGCRVARLRPDIVERPDRRRVLRHVVAHVRPAHARDDIRAIVQQPFRRVREAVVPASRVAQRRRALADVARPVAEVQVVFVEERHVIRRAGHRRRRVVAVGPWQQLDRGKGPRLVIDVFPADPGVVPHIAIRQPGHISVVRAARVSPNGETLGRPDDQVVVDLDVLRALPVGVARPGCPVLLDLIADDNPRRHRLDDGQRVDREHLVPPDNDILRAVDADRPVVGVVHRVVLDQNVL